MYNEIDSLQKINNASLAKIIFHKEKLQNLINELDFYNIIFAGNGVFVALKNEFGISIGKVSGIKYTNTDLNKLEESIIYSFIPKPPLSLFVEILEMFKYITDKCKWELCVNIYYHKTNKTFHINIIEQTIGSATAKYKYDEKFEMSNEYIRYLQIHSHNTMGANFSGIDNNDEKYTALCYYGVVGKINNTTKFYNADMCYRIWNGIEFVNLEFDDIFNTNVENIQLDKNIILRLDNIISNSKIKEKNNQESFRNTSSLFFNDSNSDVDNSIQKFLLNNSLISEM